MKKYRENVKSNHGITLIALVVTIIILIILALISINAVFGENGLVKRAEQAAEKQAAAKFEEELKLKLLDAQIGSITEGDNSFLNELFGEKIKGEYREKWTYGENLEIEIDAIIEDEGKYFRCDIIINDSIDVRNTKQVNEVDPMAEALYKFRKNSSDIEIINESGSITEIKYQETNYNVVEMSFDRNTDIIYIEPVESAKKWKNVFTTLGRAIGIDTDNKVWMWSRSHNSNGWQLDINEMQPVCLNQLYPVLNENEITNIITDDDVINGMVDSNGKIYLFDEYGYDTYLGSFCCLNDIYPEKLNNIRAKQVLISDYMRVDDRGTWQLIIIDEENKLWGMTVNIETNEANVNDLQVGDLSNILFKNIEIYDDSYYESGWHYQYFLVGLDNNGKIWRIDLDETFGTKKVECLSDSDTVGLLNKKIEQFERRLMIDEEGILYEFNENMDGVVSSLEREDIKNLKIKEIFYIPFYTYTILDTDENIWSYPSYDHYQDWGKRAEQLNIDGRYDNQKIKDVYPNGYVLDIEDNLWGEGYDSDTDTYITKKIFDFTGKTINKISANSVIMIIDSEGNLYKQGEFIRTD